MCEYSHKMGHKQGHKKASGRLRSYFTAQWVMKTLLVFRAFWMLVMNKGLGTCNGDFFLSVHSVLDIFMYCIL